MNLDHHLHDLAERQHGVVGTEQARAAGATWASRAHRERQGDWEPITARVLRRTGAPVTTGARAMAAVLDAGGAALLSHTSAAAWWRIPGFRVDPLQVTRTRGGTRRPSTLAAVHEPCGLPDHQRTELDGLPVVRPAMVIFQLAATVHPRRAERACDNAWAMRLVTGRQLHDLFNELACRGRDGTVVMRELLSRRPADHVPPASNLESRFIQILADRGLAPMDRQLDLGGSDWVGRVDFRDRELPLIVEIQSERYHAALLDREADERRLSALQAAGFVALAIWDYDVWTRPAEVAQQVSAARTALRRARAA